MGMYREEGAEEDFEYLKYYGRRLADDLEQSFPCRVHIHREALFSCRGKSAEWGKYFPGAQDVRYPAFFAVERYEKK